MKKFIFFIALFLGIFTQVKAINITKTASNNNPYVGEVFEYTISISGITSLSELGSIQDILDPNLDYISSDFNTSSTVFAFYNNWCPTSLSGLIQPASGSTGILTFKFPSVNLCPGAGSANLSFKIKVALNANACSLPNNAVISNQVKLIKQAGAPAPSSIVSLVSKIKVNSTSPWKLEKTFRSFTGGYLIYDVRLSSSVGEFNMNVLPSANFLDQFTSSPCIGADVSGSSVTYIPNEATPGSFTTIGNAVAAPYGMDFNWNLPTTTSGKTLGSYLFQVKIKTTTCSCASTPFDLLNTVKANLTDVCGDDSVLEANFDLLNVSCTNTGSISIPEDKAVCAEKKVKMDGNDLNLTMAGCKGKYIITIKNCTSSYKYDVIKFSDVFPASNLITVNTGGISVFPAVYSSALTVTSGGLNFSTTTALAPGGTITITIPFMVTTPLPNQIIKNCVNLKVRLNDGVQPPSFITKAFCDIGLKTVPNQATIITTKKLCTIASHSCGGVNSSSFLPGDQVEYALHTYNYGTTNATNVVIEDNLPANFSANVNDIKVYKISNYGNYITNICDLSTIPPGKLSNITSSSSISLVGGKLKIKLTGPNILDKFTCTGITHYIVKIKGQIALTAPNGSLTNQFTTTYKDAGSGMINSEISNPVTLVVNKDQLVITKKTAKKWFTDCVSKKARVDYEIWVLNMGYLPITVNINDIITVPSPLSISSGQGVNKPGNIQFEESPTGVPSYASMSSTVNSLTINQYNLKPCTLLKIKYSVIYNTNNLNANQVLEVKNTANVTFGYMSNQASVVSAKGNPALLPKIIVNNNAELINNYFAATSEIEKSDLIQKMKMESNIDKKMSLVKFPQAPSGPIFIPIDTIANNASVNISDCIFGSTKGCFTNSGNAANFTFKINSIDNSGKVNTTLTFAPGAPKVNKVEFILTDVRTLNPTTYLSCSNTVLGTLNIVSPSSIGGLNNFGLPSPVSGIFKERNKVEFWSGNYLTLGSTYNPVFQLPVNLNCNGNLEIVMTCIVHFEDCSVCYQSQGADHYSTFTWTIPPIYSTSILNRNRP